MSLFVQYCLRVWKVGAGQSDGYKFYSTGSYYYPQIAEIKAVQREEQGLLCYDLPDDMLVYMA